MFDRRGELRVSGTPERHQDPARAVRFLPCAERAPDAGAGELHLLVADERRPVLRRPVVFAAETARIEQPHAALLARLNGIFPSLVLEHRTGGVHVEIALAQPGGVRRRVPVRHLQRLRLRVLLHGDDGLPEDLLLREVVAVAAPRVDGAVLAD